MTNQEFLCDVVPKMNEGYRRGATGPTKLKPLHEAMNQAIALKLGSDYTAQGYGVGEGVECTVKTPNGGHWKPDLFVRRSSMPKTSSLTNGGTVDYKIPFSNVNQNIINYIGTFRSSASLVRPHGTLFGGFIMVNEQVPYFDKKGVVVKIETPAIKIVKELQSYAKTHNALDGAPDVIGLAVYRLTDFDYSKIFTKDEYIEALSDYNGKVEFVSIEGIKSEGNFLFNDFNGFIDKYVELVNKKFSGTSKEDSYANLFLRTPVEDQKRYLIEHNLLMDVKSYQL